MVREIRPTPLPRAARPPPPPPRAAAGCAKDKTSRAQAAKGHGARARGDLPEARQEGGWREERTRRGGRSWRNKNGEYGIAGKDKWQDKTGQDAAAAEEGQQDAARTKYGNLSTSSLPGEASVKPRMTGGYVSVLPPPPSPASRYSMPRLSLAYHSPPPRPLLPPPSSARLNHPCG